MSGLPKTTNPKTSKQLYMNLEKVRLQQPKREYPSTSENTQKLELKATSTEEGREAGSWVA